MMFGTGLVTGIISLLVGILILIKPNLLAYIVGVYLIVIGLVAVAGALARF